MFPQENYDLHSLRSILRHSTPKLVLVMILGIGHQQEGTTVLYQHVTENSL